jgi:hypothetical protein
MGCGMKRYTSRFLGSPLVSGLATVLVAATVDPAANWVRLRTLPRSERERLVENLRRFDLVLTREQQQALRELDRRINELEPALQMQYLVVLRRYHNWLNQLPEIKQDGLSGKPADERMALVKKLLQEYPVPKAHTKEFLKIVDIGDNSPFELAAIYQIWQKLNPEDRRQVEQVPVSQRRRDAIFRLGVKHNLPREVMPEGFDEEKWSSELESFVKKTRPVLLFEELKKKQESRRAEIVRRQAINYHFLAKDRRPKAVTADHLAEFLKSFPPWLKASFDHYPPDEARRRLTVVYRLVFPPGSEVKISEPAATSAPESRTSPVPSRERSSSATKSGTDGARSPF